MDFDQLIDNCQAIETSIQALIKNNASKQDNLNNLQTKWLESFSLQQKQLAELEQKLQIDLDSIKGRCEELELQIKQVNLVNDELCEVVRKAQQAAHNQTDATKRGNDRYHFMGKVIDYLDKIRSDYNKIKDSVQTLQSSDPKDSLEAKRALDECKALVVEFQKNARLIRILEKQGYFAEQQFDLILNQIPWEPLTAGYIKELRVSNNEEVRNLADNLALQVSEIEDLEESLVVKKKKKLDLLKSLNEQLELFVRKRSEAIMMEGKKFKQ